jgi:hypothetical protein
LPFGLRAIVSAKRRTDIADARQCSCAGSVEHAADVFVDGRLKEQEGPRDLSSLRTSG